MPEAKNPFTKTTADFLESKATNDRKNRNNRNDTLTNFFKGLLEGKTFKNIILVALSLIVLTFAALAFFLGLFIFKENIIMINEVLGIMFKIGAPCVIFFLFFIKFGDHKNHLS